MQFTPQQIQSFFLSQALVWGPLVLGHQLRHRGRIRQEVSKPLQSFNLAFICPVIYALGIWRLEPGQGEWPKVLGLMTGFLLLGTVGGLWLSPKLMPARKSSGTLSVMIPLSNTGHTMAGFLTIFLYGSGAYAYNAVLMVPVTLFLLLIWMPLGQHWGTGLGHSLRRNYARVLFSVQMLPLLGVGLGLFFKWRGLVMTPGWATFLSWTVFGSTALTCFALGTRLHLRAMPAWAWPLPIIYALKFVVFPLVMAALCWAVGLSGPAAGALLIASMMPVGVMVVGVATIYELDIDLANAGFLWSTLLFMIAVLPILIWLVGLPWLR